MNRPVMLAALLLAAAAVALSAGCSSGDSTGPEEIVLLFEDNFDGPAGQSPDPGKWVFDIGTDWGNAQLEYDTDRPENVSLDGEGNLAIVALKENEPYEGCDYTSGRIKTQGRFSHARGRFEARIKLPVGQGLWPAFWLLGNSISTVGWPACGEIDIMEYRGQEPDRVHGSLHGPGYSGGSAVTGSYRIGGDPFNEGFHVFAVEWDQDRVSWFVDGVEYQRRGPGDLPPGAGWVFNQAHFIILNVAVGGNFVGPPNGATTFPQTMLVDWVRVYGVR